MDAAILANAASGGLVGLAGAGVSAVTKYFEGKREAKQRVAEREHELKLLELQARHESKRRDDELEASLAEREAELEAERATADTRLLGASIKADAAETASGGVPGWARAVRTVTRPALTAGLIVCTMLLWGDLVELASTGTGALARLLPAERAADLAEYIATSLAFSASTAITWWFADRALTPPRFKHR